MRKKTRKGGESFLEKRIPYIKDFNKKGEYIADDIDYNIRQGKKEELIKKYDDYLYEAKRDVERAKGDKERNDRDEEIQNKKDNLKLERQKFLQTKFEFFVVVLGNIFKFFGDNVGYFANFFTKNGFKLFDVAKSFGSGLFNLFNVGQGVIIKTIVLIGIIIALFFGINSFIELGNNRNPQNKINEITSTDKNYSSFLIKTSSPSFFGNLSNSFYNLVPQDYKIQFNFFKNKFNSIIGNDIYELNGTPRETINTGRNDGIYHIKKKDDNSNTYTTLKPKDINIDIKFNNENSDYNKLPENIKNLFPINNKLILPVENRNGIWVYNPEKIRYDGSSNAIIDTNSKYKNIFMNTSNINEFKFNKEKAEIYNDNDKRSSVILDKIFDIDQNKYKYPKI
jgi:hypothetical protein